MLDASGCKRKARFDVLSANIYLSEISEMQVVYSSFANGFPVHKGGLPIELTPSASLEKNTLTCNYPVSFFHLFCLSSQVFWPCHRLSGLAENE